MIEKKLDFNDVLLVPQRSDLESRSEVDINRDFHFKYSKQTLTAFPIIAANMDSVGTFAMAQKLAEFGAMTALHKFYSVEKLARFFQENPSIWNSVFYTVGANVNDLKKLKAVSEIVSIPDFPRMICLDAANGYSKHFIGNLIALRETYPNAVIMAGNVVTPNMTEELILQGADLVKIGLGNGSVCLTRMRTGVGYPQLSAIIECSFAAHGLGGHVVSDGGCTCEGDICKALCAGADFVMTGSMFNATDECEGEWEYDKTTVTIPSISDQEYVLYHKYCNKKYFKYHGMSSKEAMDQWYGGMADYRASEGKEVKIPYKGPVEPIIKSIAGGIRSCCTLIGARKLKHMPRCSEFIVCTNQSNRLYERL